MKPTGQQLVDKSKELWGQPYIYGYEIEPLEKPHPRAADCSEDVEWVCFQCGIRPFMPDGAVFQFRHCVNHGCEIEIVDAIKTPGALLFHFSANPLEYRPAKAHVAWSQGNGKTSEARGAAYGIGEWDAANRDWTHAALVPGVEYPGWEG